MSARAHICTTRYGAMLVGSSTNPRPGPGVCEIYKRFVTSRLGSGDTDIECWRKHAEGEVFVTFRLLRPPRLETFAARPCGQNQIARNANSIRRCVQSFGTLASLPSFRARTGERLWRVRRSATCAGEQRICCVTESLVCTVLDGHSSVCVLSNATDLCRQATTELLFTCTGLLCY